MPSICNRECNMVCLPPLNSRVLHILSFPHPLRSPRFHLLPCPHTTRLRETSVPLVPHLILLLRPLLQPLLVLARSGHPPAHHTGQRRCNPGREQGKYKFSNKFSRLYMPMDNQRPHFTSLLLPRPLVLHPLVPNNPIAMLWPAWGLVWP